MDTPTQAAGWGPCDRVGPCVRCGEQIDTTIGEVVTDWAPLEDEMLGFTPDDDDHDYYACGACITPAERYVMEAEIAEYEIQTGLCSRCGRVNEHEDVLDAELAGWRLVEHIIPDGYRDEEPVFLCSGEFLCPACLAAEPEAGRVH